MNCYKSIFSYILVNYADVVSSDNHKKFCSVCTYTLCTDSCTPLQHGKINSRELIIFGYAVDVFSGQREKLAETILDSTNSLAEVIDYEKKLGGKYVIFYAENGKCYCIGDATCSIPVFYTTGLPDFVCSGNPNEIIKRYGLKPDAELQKIRDSGPLNQAMPYDVTPYKEIKQLIPNHYLDFSEGKAIRFVNSNEKQKEISPEKAAEITAPMIENITKMYLSDYDIYCPLTSGRDSRVVYAFLKKLHGNVNSYTIWKDSFKKDSQDWDVPVELAKLGNGNHEQIYKETVTPEMKHMMDEILGVNGYPEDALTLSVTVNRHYGDYATLEGDIIGQVGKCSLHRDIPLFLASPAYFRCKLHNYSDGAKKLLKKWMNDIKNSGEKVNVFDLFSVENRLGVWASHTHLIRNTMGQAYFNIFNSRSIIYVWTGVERARRMNSEIHVELIKRTAPELLEIPFEKDQSGLINFAKSNAMVFYSASFAKYYIQKRKFFQNKEKATD